MATPAPNYSYGRPQVDPEFLRRLYSRGAGDYGRPAGRFDVAYDDSTSPERMTQQDRARAYNLGDIVMQEGSERLPYYGGLEERSQRTLDAAYEPIARGQGGYSPAEQAQYARLNELYALGLTSDEISQMGLRGDEQGAIAGDPRSAFDYYNPRLGYGMAESARDRQREVRGQGGAGVRGALDRYNLTLDPGVAGSQQTALARMDEELGGAIPRETLGLDAGFAANYPLSDTEVEDISTLAGSTVGARYQSDIDRAGRQARASGMASPLAVQALTSRLRRESAADAGDAVAGARLGALGQQREQRRLLETLRLGSERDISDRVLNRAFGAADTRLAEQRGMEGLRLGAAGRAAGLRTGSEQYLMGAGLESERDIGNRMMDLYGYLQDQGINLERTGEQQASGRRRYLAENRQETARYVPSERFRRGAYAGEEASRRMGNIYDTRRGDEQEYRGHLAGQQELGGRRYGESSERRTRGALGAGQLAAEATRSRIAGRNRQGWWSRNIAPMSQSAGSAFGAYQAA